MNFLNSSDFEEMAREYNKKYNSNKINVLDSNNWCLDNSFEIVFQQMFNLIANLKSTFCKYKKFNSFFENAEKFKREVNAFCKNNFNLTINSQNEVNATNHKQCAIAMLNCYIEIFNFNIKVLKEINDIKNYLKNNFDDNKNNKQENLIESSNKKIECLLLKLLDFQQIFKTFSELLKQFYVVIN